MKASDKQKIIDNTNSYYRDKIIMYGTNSMGVDWNSEDGQRKRYEQLSKVYADVDEKITVCDYGCGYGYYFGYLLESNMKFFYEGIDLCKEMIDSAYKLYPLEKFGDKCCFLNQSNISKKYDYIVSSGIFNVRQNHSEEQWLEYIIDTINLFNECSQKGFSFNCLTKYSDLEYMKDYLYYADPLFFFDYCNNKFSRNVDLLHGYDLYEFTIIVRK